MKRVYGGQKRTTGGHTPLRIGLTGGIGSGKSTVAKQFGKQGVPVIDTDHLARELVEPGSPALQQIVAHFGETILLPEGTLDRAQLRSRIFDDPQARCHLEEILHPLIRAEMRERLRHIDAPYCILEIPLLLESGWRPEVDRVLVVDAPPELQMERTLQRGGIHPEEVERILATQLERDQRLTAADDVIVNDRDIPHLEGQVKQLHVRYREMTR